MCPYSYRAIGGNVEQLDSIAVGTSLVTFTQENGRWTIGFENLDPEGMDLFAVQQPRLSFSLADDDVGAIYRTLVTQAELVPPDDRFSVFRLYHSCKTQCETLAEGPASQWSGGSVVAVGDMALSLASSNGGYCLYGQGSGRQGELFVGSDGSVASFIFDIVVEGLEKSTAPAEAFFQLIDQLSQSLSGGVDMEPGLVQALVDTVVSSENS